MDKWSIIVPAADPDNLKRLLGSLAEPEDRVVAVVGPEFPRAGFGVRFVDRPPGPFVFSASINAGLATIPWDWDVVMSSDDVAFRAGSRPEQLVELSRIAHGMYLIHPSVCGNTFGHQEIKARGRRDLALIPTPCPLPLICAVLPARIRTTIGPWDETFTGYGYEDHDYVRRAEEAGFRYVVYHLVEILHSEERSVYRRRRDFPELMKANRDRYFEKWGEAPLR